MRPSKARFITACQQLLALGVVLAVLTPAASVISLDVVHQVPGESGRAPSGKPAAGFAAYTQEARTPSRVPTAPVDAELTEIALTGEAPAASGKRGALGAPVTARAKLDPLADGGQQLTSLELPVDGYAGVGLTWDPASALDDHDAGFAVRTRTGSDWSAWTEVPFHDEHGPDPDSPEGQQARPGTDLVLVGDVDAVQVRGRVADALPDDLRLAVTAPGRAERTARELPDLDTTAAAPVAEASEGATGSEADEEEGLDLQAATYTPQPVIYSRKQWGANEQLRDRGSLRYFEVHAGFVHHTVNANDYSRGEVPGILRSIYAYHTQSRGWSDVGYNFLVDKFGRIWEGRAGGIARPVVGAHTLGYNDYAFAMSAIGNFETRRPTDAMVEAYGSLMAWKLSLHGVDASATKQVVGPDTFPAINGHRDAGSTACPGRYLYARIGDIRRLAEAAQQDWSGRELESDLASTPHPDLAVRRASDGQVFIVPTGGLTGLQPGATLAGAATGTDLTLVSPDLTGDRVGDLVVRGTDGVTRIRPGTTAGGFGDPVKPTQAFAGRTLVTAVGDLDEDGNADLVARNAAGALNVYLGGGGGGFERRRSEGTSVAAYNRLVGTGDTDGDGHVDLLARDGDGRLWRLPGTGTKNLGQPEQVSAGWARYDTITGFGDWDRDGRGDLLVRVSDGDAFVRPARPDGTFAPAVGPIPRLRTGSALSAAQLTRGAAPEVVLRRGDDLVRFVNPGTFDLGRPIATGVRVPGATAVLNAGDWDRDGFGDLVTRTPDGALQLRRGNGRGTFAEPVRLALGFGGVGLIAAVGDMTGDGWPDLMGQPSGGSMRIYPGKGVNGLRPSYVAHTRISAGRQVPVGRWNPDGAPDSLFRSGDRLMLFPGNGPGGLTSGRTLGLDLSPYDWVVGVSDVTLTGHSDVLVRARRSGRLYLIPATRDGFRPRRYLGEGMGGFQLVG